MKTAISLYRIQPTALEGGYVHYGIEHVASLSTEDAGIAQKFLKNAKKLRNAAESVTCIQVAQGQKITRLQCQSVKGSRKREWQEVQHFSPYSHNKKYRWKRIDQVIEYCA